MKFLNQFNQFQLPEINLPQNTEKITRNISNLSFRQYEGEFSNWLQSLMDNIFFRQIYSFIIGIIKFIGNIIVWILEILINLIKSGLSYIR